MTKEIGYSITIDGVKFPVTKQQNATITKLRDNEQDADADIYTLCLRNKFNYKNKIKLRKQFLQQNQR